MEAQRYPADFDGIVAIAPAYNFLAITTTFVRNLQAQYATGDTNAPVVTPAVVELMAAKVTERCDASDGVRHAAGVVSMAEGSEERWSRIRWRSLVHGVLFERMQRKPALASPHEWTT